MNVRKVITIYLEEISTVCCIELGLALTALLKSFLYETKHGRYLKQRSSGQEWTIATSRYSL